MSQDTNHDTRPQHASSQSELARLYNAGVSFQELQQIARRPNAEQHRLRSIAERRHHHPPSTLSRSTNEVQRDSDHYLDDIDEKEGEPSPATHVHNCFTDNDVDDDITINMDKVYHLPSHKFHAYQQPLQPRRPLVDFVRNEWRTNPKFGPGPYPLSPDNGPTCPNWAQVLTAPRLRRYIFTSLILLLLFWVNWRWWIHPIDVEDAMLNDALSERIKTGQGWFGANVRPTFSDMIQLKTLDRRLVPQNGDMGRLIVVGDVHGCHDECKFCPSSHSSIRNAFPFELRQGPVTDNAVQSLFSKVSFNSATDHLIFAGDLISKGPSSPAVIDVAISMRASCVRGNHEDRVLLAYRDVHSPRLSLAATGEANEESYHATDRQDPDLVVQPYERMEEESFSHGDGVDRDLARSFNKQQIDYLSSCPVILKVGELPGMGEIVVVHAGLVPGVDLERQDPMGVMTMRTIDLETHVPSRRSEGTPWTKVRSPPGIRLATTPQPLSNRQAKPP